jgi:phospholipid/cholesterol/gamma-HCH transport system substrate-binding protein
MPQQLHWRNLKGGIIAAAVIAVLTFIVLVYARVGALHGKKVTLYVVTDEAPGVLAGTEVWLAGKKEGVVKDITFRPVTADTLERILIITDVLEEALPGVRRDSYAQIRPGGRMIGTPVIFISPGTTATRALHDGDTVFARPKAAVGDLAEDVGSIVPEVKDLGAATTELANKLDRPVGTIGNARRNGFEDFPDVSAGVSSLYARGTLTGGTIASASRTRLMAHAQATMGAADSIRRLVSSNNGTMGRFRRDSTLVTKARHVLAELDTLALLIQSPVGTIAAVHSDSALARELNREHVLMDALVKDMKSNPGRYIRF